MNTLSTQHTTHIVTIGGGSGQPTLLRALTSRPVHTTAIVTMMDSGGSSGRLREQYHVLPPGDVRRCLLALSATPQQYDWWEHRFEAGDVAGHPIGNIVLTGLFQQHPVQTAIDRAAELLRVQGRVLAVTDESTQLHARLSDGTAIVGEAYFDQPAHSAAVQVDKVLLEPSVSLAPTVADAITHADMIVLTMGDVYTSVIPNLLVTGLPAALAAASAPIVLICNRSAKRGETEGYSTADIVAAIERYLAPAQLSVVIVDDGSVPLPPDALPITTASLPTHIRVVTADLSDPDDLALVSGEKAADILMTLAGV